MRPLALFLLLGGCAQVEALQPPPALSDVRTEIAEAQTSVVKDPPGRVSLFRAHDANLFADRIALAEGDVITVLVAIDDSARFRNRSDRQRSTSRTLGGEAESDVGGVSKAMSGSAGVRSGTAYDGDGATARSETVRLRIAASVVEVLPGGNLSIEGRQEVRINHELRRLDVAGIVRPSDIAPDNTVPLDRIAEARVSYGGEGPVFEMQKPPWGQRVIDAVLPL